MRNAGYPRSLVGVPFFCIFFFPELRTLANREDAGLPCGRAGIAHGCCRRFAITPFFFFIFVPFPLLKKKKIFNFFSIFFQVFLVWILTKHTISC